MPEDADQWLTIATSVIASASAIAAVTPTPVDNKVLFILRRIIDALALNEGRAKSKEREIADQIRRAAKRK